MKEIIMLMISLLVLQTALLTAQNGKKLDIQSPVSGIIVARNERLYSDTAILNSSP